MNDTSHSSLPTDADYFSFDFAHSKWPSIKFWVAEATRAIHHHNQKWWQDPKTGEPIKRNHGELLMLVTSELAEALEGDRKNLMDDKLPHRKMIEVELADAVIRIMDMAAGLNLDLAGAIVEKCEYNTTRKDHTHEARLAPGGKAY